MSAWCISTPIRYPGSGGVQLSNFWRKLVFGWKFDGTQFLVSSYPTSESRILFHRQIHERVALLAPFLEWNAAAIPHKLPALWDALGVEDLEEAGARILQIMERCGLETRLQGLGIGGGDIETMLDHTRWDRLDVMPRPIDREEMRGLLQGLM